jgi:ABC-type cobalamin transport system permease subunit
MTEKMTLPRPRWYAVAIVGAVVAIAALSIAALQTDDDTADTVFGAFTGAIGVGLLALILWTEIARKQVARLRDAAALDDLEPMRAATDADRADER